MGLAVRPRAVPRPLGPVGHTTTQTLAPFHLTISVQTDRGKWGGYPLTTVLDGLGVPVGVEWRPLCGTPIGIWRSQNSWLLWPVSSYGTVRSSRLFDIAPGLLTLFGVAPVYRAWSSARGAV